MSQPVSRYHWTLKQTLEHYGITRYALQKKSGVSMNAVRAMYDGKTARVDLPLVERLVTALSELTGHPMTVSDVLSWDVSSAEERCLLQTGATDLGCELAELEKDVPDEALDLWLGAFAGQQAQA